MATKNDVVIDSLPYIDKHFEDPAVQTKVNDLVQRELSSFKPKSSQLPAEVNVFADSPFLTNELERISKSAEGSITPPPDGIDTTRYTLTQPQDNSDLGSWKRASDNAHAQLLHQNTRLENLQLLQKYGGNAWRMHNFQLEHEESALERQLQQANEERDAINKQRKGDQIKAGRRLDILERQWAELIGSTMHLESVNAQLEAEIQALKLSAPSS